ncbi:MAG TPA: winged helix DNA-binding domain-containing protein [Streptosporangiaceae bacterium]|nr:winged helix DNA-binding domain-containing protein [Streptosporangiaceae bacterium]
MTVSGAGPGLTAERCRAQLLTGPPGTAVTSVVRHLLAVQGQDPRGFRLSVRARSTGLTAAAVDQALSADRSVLVSTLNRGTLHLVCAEDYWWLHALTTPPLAAASTRRLSQEKVPPDDAERAVAEVVAALDGGPMTRAQLRERVERIGVRTEGQAHVHILMAATLRGLIVRGPVVGADHAYVLTRDWLGVPPRLPARDVMLAELARRYLAGHGPADDRDLAKWSGLSLGDARRGLSAVSGLLAERDDGLASLACADGPDAGLPPPRLHGSFDPLLHGWADRSFVLGATKGIVTSNGVFRPFALVNGRAVATWSLAAGRIRLTPFAPLAEADEAVLAADADKVLDYLGMRRPRA